MSGESNGVEWASSWVSLVAGRYTVCSAAIWSPENSDSLLRPPSGFFDCLVFAAGGCSIFSVRSPATHTTDIDNRPQCLCIVISLGTIHSVQYSTDVGLSRFKKQ